MKLVSSPYIDLRSKLMVKGVGVSVYNDKNYDDNNCNVDVMTMTTMMLLKTCVDDYNAL